MLEGSGYLNFARYNYRSIILDKSIVIAKIHGPEKLRIY